MSQDVCQKQDSTFIPVLGRVGDHLNCTCLADRQALWCVALLGLLEVKAASIAQISELIRHRHTTPPFMHLIDTALVDVRSEFLIDTRQILFTFRNQGTPYQVVGHLNAEKGRVETNLDCKDEEGRDADPDDAISCLLYTSPSPRDSV